MDKPNSKKSRDEIAQAYSSTPWWYDVRGFFILTFAYNSSIWEQLVFFGKNIRERHLEVACGTGTLLEMVLKWRRWKNLPKARITGIDYAESMLQGAIHRFAGQPNIDFRHADAAALPYENNCFDSANIANSIHCLPDVDGALKDIFRVLKPGGLFAANVLLYPKGPQPLKWIAERINAWGIRKGILFTPYHSDDISQRLLKAGFLLLRQERSGNCFNVLAQKPTLDPDQRT